MYKKLFGSLLLATAAVAAAQPAAARSAVVAKAPAPVVTAGQIILPSGVVGQGATVAAQVDDMATQLHKRLAASGGIGSMLQHTLYLKALDRYLETRDPRIVDRTNSVSL